MANITDRLNKVLETVNANKISSVAFKEFVKNTPIRSGNARRNTHLAGNAIIADYAYAQRLEEGYSDQSPSGMTAPTIEFIRAYIQQRLGITIK